MALLFGIIALHIYLLSRLIFFPYPELFIYPYLTKIGIIPYKEIFDQHFPGLMFFPTNLATLGIDTPEEMRLLQYSLIVISHTLLYSISNKLFKDKKLLILPNILYLIWQPIFEGYVLWIDSFVAPVFLIAYYFAHEFSLTKNKKALFWVGFSLAIASLLKQVVFPYIAIYGMYLLFKYKKFNILGIFILGLSIPLLFLAYFVFNNGMWSDFLYWTYTFNVTIFAEMGRKYFTLGEFLRTLPTFGLTVTLLLYYWYRSKKLANNVILLILFFIGSLIFVYARQDYVHLQPALVFVVLIIPKIIESLFNKKLLILYSYLFISMLLVSVQLRGLMGDKNVFYSSEELEVARSVDKHTNSGDSIFAFGTLPHIYQMTNTIPSGNMFVFQFPWFMKVVESRILEGLVVDPPVVVIRDKTASVSGINLTSYMSMISEYVDMYYQTVDTVGTVEIMISNKI